jgi:hypothetical protein
MRACMVVNSGPGKSGCNVLVRRTLRERDGVTHTSAIPVGGQFATVTPQA